jgi:2-oxoglutarate ferredoxin oxidoreductase subunit alpha
MREDSIIIMREDSIIIADAKAKPSKPEHCRAQLIELPLTLTGLALASAIIILSSLIS